MNILLLNIKKIVPNVSEKIYNSIDLNSLIAYSVLLLEKNNLPITFENIYVFGYLSFPKRFSLVGFPEFPDGARINRAILQCLPKYQNLLIGKATKGYKLTQLGISRAQEVERKIKLGYMGNSKEKRENLNRAFDYTKQIEELSSKPAFKKFSENKQEEVGVDDIFDFIETSPYSGKSIISKKIEDYLSIAKYGKSKKLEEFLRWIKTREDFKAYLK